MIKEVESQTITAVIGATLRAVFIVENTYPSDKVMATFSCPDLHIQEDLFLYNESSDSEEELDPAVPGGQQSWLLWRDTDDLRPGEFFYNMTVTNFIGIHPFPTTYVYHGRLVILPEKPPRTSYNPYWEYIHNTKNEHD